MAGVSETYAYDGDGVRFSRQVGAGPVIRFVTDPAVGLPVTLDDGVREQGTRTKCDEITWKWPWE